jgi:uncharacterized protein
MTPFREVISSIDQLRDHYRAPSSLVQAKKVVRLDDVTRRFIATATFCIIATSDAEGQCDASPRGGPPGFVKVLDDHHVVLPDLSGNNLLDSLTNVVTNPHIALLVMIPGRDETLRLDGAACLTTDPEVLGLWDDELRTPKVAIGIEVHHVFIHCAKSFRRGGVWQPESWPSVDLGPDACEVLASHIKLETPLAELRAGLERDYAKSLSAERAEVAQAGS